VTYSATEDRLAINDLHARYCRGVDRLDRALLLSVFHPDAVEHHGSWFDGPATEYVDRVLELAAGGWGLPCAHLVAAGTTEVVGELAWSEAPFYSLSRVEATGRVYDYTFVARFLARCERRHGTWRFIERTLVEDLCRLDPVERVELPGWPSQTPTSRGLRTPSDPSYLFFAEAAAARNG
jgi:SnoaL-like domain